MDRELVALVLEDIGTLLELNGGDRFRVRAFYAAARALARADQDVAGLVRSGRLRALPGLGSVTAGVVEELLATGGSSLHTELLERTPEGMIELLRVRGLGARRIRALHEALGVETLADVEAAAAAGRIAGVAGFGPATEARIREGIAFLRASTGLRRQPEALRAAERLAGYLESLPGVARVRLAGELRRRLEVVSAVELVAQTSSPEAVLDAFLELPGGQRAERTGPASAEVRYADQLPLRLHCVPEPGFAAAWVLATGSEAHVAGLRERAGARGLRLAPDGLWRGTSRLDAADEAALYARLGLDWVAPELREGGEELAQAEAGALPRLLEPEELRGCFHVHTTASDGTGTLVEMAEAARARGWSYLGIADHSQAATYAGGLTPARVREQHAAIDAWNAAHGAALWLFKGVEADILPDGRLDYEEQGDEVLGRFDYVVASVHSGFAQDEAQQTARVKRALANPHVTFLGHPLGRLLLSRAGIRLDLGAVLEEAGRLGVGAEINANPRRLELDWRWWPLARARGVRAAINPDAHAPAGLDDLAYGVGVARKGGLGPEDVVNAWERERVAQYFAERRRR